MEDLQQLFNNKKICILGYGREGRSTLRWLQKHVPGNIKALTIADENPAALKGRELQDIPCKLRYGYDYLAGIKNYDLVIKSPGVNLSKANVHIPEAIITSQSDLFLRQFSEQCIGITGTKGKSTCSSLLYEMLLNSGFHVIFLGNIGSPPLDAWSDITPQTKVVFELSSHQLEHITKGPSTAILLNLFQEHLDHYTNFRHYQLAKFNITLKQTPGSILITHYNDGRISSLLKDHPLDRDIQYFSHEKHNFRGMYIEAGDFIHNTKNGSSVFAGCGDLLALQGKHNQLNVMAAALAALNHNSDKETLKRTMAKFKGLNHRMEYVANVNGVIFYNDAVATVPEATMAAVEALKNTGTLILGGFDRGINYTELARFLCQAKIDNLIFMGDAGSRILSLMKCEAEVPGSKIFFAEDMEKALRFAVKHTRAGSICLLSPAAPSYDKFRNFEHKGNTFKEFIYKLK
ncbi:MAG: UDP-N-acetylmuramoyl-L-alanine--D-glutamate ligase [Bacteroidales bacterium]